METETNIIETDIGDVLRSVFERTDETVLVVDPTPQTVDALVDAATGFDGTLPTIRMLAAEGVLKDVMEDFLVASNAADLVDAGSLEIHTTEQDFENTLLVTDETVFALVTANDRVAALTTDDESFVETAFETYQEAWDNAPAYTLRTPPISQVRASLQTEIGDAATEDFEAVLSSLETARGDGDGLDEVTISLLVAAKNDVLLYDISKWGEDVGIASKATFSRTKTELEDMGLIDTEKVPIDVGRPRLRLKLGDERLKEASPDQLASVAQSLLAS